MRTLVMAAFLASLASGQRAADPVIDRVFSVTQLESPREYQETVNVLRTVLGAPRVTANEEQRTLTLQGSADQIGLAEWLLSELDQPPIEGPADSAPHEYRLSGTSEIVRVFYLRTASPQTAQELINVIRALANLNRIMPSNVRRAIVARGNADQIGLTEWLVANLDTLPPPQTRRPAVEHRTTGVPGETTRVYYLASAAKPQDIQTVINAIRKDAQLNRLMPFTSRAAVALRGTEAQMATADRLIQELDMPAAAH